MFELSDARLKALDLLISEMVTALSAFQKVLDIKDEDIDETDSPEGAEETAPENGETAEPTQDTPAREALEDNESQEAADPTDTDE